MSRFLFLLLLFFPCLLSAQTRSVRFEAVNIYVDSGAAPLSAYQLHFRVGNGDAQIVGIEGGSHPAFSEPPFYDPKAIQQEKVIIGAFSTAAQNELPRGKTRVATIHLQLSGISKPEFTLHLQTAASVDGQKIPAKATVVRVTK